MAGPLNSGVTSVKDLTFVCLHFLISEMRKLTEFVEINWGKTCNTDIVYNNCSISNNELHDKGTRLRLSAHSNNA